ncbi:hypothetical protein ACFX1R_042782 [Malus domestica]
MEAESHQCSGEIHVIVGPMFAGKATTLLRKVQSKRGDGTFDSPFYAVAFFSFCLIKKKRYEFSFVLKRNNWVDCLSDYENVECLDDICSIWRNLKFTEIHVIVGPMFAGKTIMLLRKVQSERGDNRFDSPTYSVAFCSFEV